MTRRANQGHFSIIQNSCKRPSSRSGRVGCDRSKRSSSTLEIAPDCRGIDIIDRAAALRGRSRTDFVRDAAVRAAEDVLMETVPIRMSAAGFKAFMTALSGPGTAVPEMVELFRRAAPWEANGSKTGS